MTETGYDPAAAITEILKDMTPDQAVKMVRELCAQLSADAEGFHGNIWPDNIRLDWEGKAVLGDPSEEPANRREAEQVEYLAPEFFWDNEGSAAADVYSLGMLLYAACSEGYLPFQPRGGLLTAKDRSGALRKRMKGEPVAAPTNVSPALAEIIRKALSYEPEDRYISAAELLHALGETDEALPAPETAASEEETVPAYASEPEEATAPEASVSETVPETEDEEEAAPTENDAESDAPEEQDEPAEAESGEAEAAPEETEETPAEEPDLNEILESELSFLDLPNAEDATDEAEDAAEPAPEPKYTVQKDFEGSFSEPAAIPAANKKKRSSPLIPILCVAAVVIIAAMSVILQNRGRPAETPEAEESVTYTIEPVLATAPPSPIPAEVTPSLDDDAHARPEESPAPEAPDEEDASGRKGSATIDGLDVEPLDDTVEISDTGANLRIGPGTNYRVAESLPRGTVLTRTGTVNGWSQVQYNDEEYYIASNLVVPVETPAAEEGAVPSVVSGGKEILGSIVVSADVNIRSGPGTDYAKVGEAKTGTRLTPLGRSDDGKWYHISLGDTEGYVNRNFVSVQDYAEVTGMTGTLKIERDVNLRSGPGTGYDILGTGKTGDTFTLTGKTDNGWYRIQNNGKMAYLSADYASVS